MGVLSMIVGMSSSAPAPTLVPARDELDPRFTWDLTAIFPDWNAWEEHTGSSIGGIEAFQQFEGTLAQGPHRLLAALTEQDELGQLAYKVWYYASLNYDQDQRDNVVNGRRQRVQMLMARWRQATSWFNPELLRIPIETVRSGWTASPALARLPLLHRGPVPAAGARAGRSRRAAAVALEPAGRRAARRLCGALDRRRAGFRPSRCRPARASRSATGSIASCSRPAGSRAIGGRPTRRCTTPTRRRSTPTPRSTTA